MELIGRIEWGGGYYMQLQVEEGGGVEEPEGCSFTKISNIGLYVSVNVLFNCRPHFVRSYI
jgi:hypothetical protein